MIKYFFILSYIHKLRHKTILCRLIILPNGIRFLFFTNFCNTQILFEIITTQPAQYTIIENCYDWKFSPTNCL